MIRHHTIGTMPAYIEQTRHERLIQFWYWPEELGKPAGLDSETIAVFRITPKHQTKTNYMTYLFAIISALAFLAMCYFGITANYIACATFGIVFVVGIILTTFTKNYSK